MKIIFLEAVQTYGGARKSTVELAQNIQENNDVLIIDAWGCCQEFVNEVKERNLKLEILNSRKSPLTLEAKNIFSKPYVIIKFIYEHFKLKKSLKKSLDNFKPDIIIVNNPKTLSLIKSSKKYKIVFFAREWMLPQQIKKRSKNMFVKKVDSFICVSEASRHALYSGNIAQLKDIHVVPNSIYIDENFIKETSSELTMIHCGGFLPTKGQLTIVEIARKLKKVIPNFKIYMVGIIYTTKQSGNFLLEIKKLIKKYDLEDYIEIIINTKEMNEIYSKSKILLHPSDTEGLPRVIMEAMAHKVAVIANPVGGVNDFVLNGFTGYIATYNDVDDYISKIVELYDNKILCNYITKNAFELVKCSYTKELQVEKFELILQKISKK